MYRTLDAICVAHPHITHLVVGAVVIVVMGLVFNRRGLWG